MAKKLKKCGALLDTGDPGRTPHTCGRPVGHDGAHRCGVDLFYNNKTCGKTWTTIPGGYCGLRVKSRDGKQVGVATGATRRCGMEGCTGMRIAVRWIEAKDKYRITWPCSKGMDFSPKKRSAKIL